MLPGQKEILLLVEMFNFIIFESHVVNQYVKVLRTLFYLAVAKCVCQQKPPFFSFAGNACEPHQMHLEKLFP